MSSGTPSGTPVAGQESTGGSTGGTGSGSNNDSNTSGSNNNNNNNRNRVGNRNNYNRDNSNKSFEGAEPSVGAVLGLTSERIDKKVSFEQFKEKLENYIGRKFDNGDDIVCIVKDYSDPMVAFEKSINLMI